MSNSNFDSYPPIFRPSDNPIHEPDRTKVKEGGGLDPLPIIDMQSLDLKHLDKVCKEWGIFRLVNHGIPTNLLVSLHEHGKRIFNLPYEAKQDFVDSNNNCPLKYFWGTPALTPNGSPLERTSGDRVMDWMEGLNVSFSLLQNHHHLFDDNPLMNEFRELLKVYREHVTKIASTIFEAMIRSLKLDIEAARSYLDESSGLVRVYRYPRKSTAEGVQGLHVHTDSSVLSILSENEVGGLQFLKDDHWLNVQPIPGTFVVNLGDMMQVVSDDKYKSVKHKVELNKHNERLSICYFVFPEENTLIYSSKYKPFTYHDFRAQVQEDIKTIGRKIGLQSLKT